MVQVQPKEIPKFTVHIATSNDQSSHNIGISSDGKAYTWGKTNALGQLGRPGKKNIPQHALFSNPQQQTLLPQQKELPMFVNNIKAIKGFVGGFKDAGHSAILDEQGYLWLSGCDRWQQLGLGSSVAGAAGYTWKNGALWQETFQRNNYLRELMENHENGHDNDTKRIRDVALGGDHTLVLSENKRDVFAFGKGREGQLGLQAQKPFVSSPIHAKGLSSKKSDIAAVCAMRHCSFTLDDNGDVLKQSGKCQQWSSELMVKTLRMCRERARNDDLIQKNEKTK